MARPTGANNELGLQLCRTLNLNPADVMKLVFTWHPTEQPVVEVSLFTNPIDFPIGDLKKYHLVPVEEPHDG